jgi:hypothetical protein
MLNALVGLQSGDRERLRWTTIASGRAVIAARDIANAAVDVIAGDPARMADVDAAIDRMDDTGHHYSAAMFRRARALFAPDDPGAAAQARRAASWFRGVGAVAALAGLERWLDGEAAGADSALRIEEPAGA